MDYKEKNSSQFDMALLLLGNEKPFAQIRDVATDTSTERSFAAKVIPCSSLSKASEHCII